MDNLLNFYNALFGIQISVFGIISAVILVFIQLVYSNYSYKHIGHILRNPFLVLFFVLSVIDLCLTAVASYFLSLNSHNFLPSVDLGINNTFASPLYAFICLALIFASISFFIILIVKNITYLQPHRAIFLLSESINYTNIRDFLWKENELDPPFAFRLKVVGGRFELDDTTNLTAKERKAKEEAGKKELARIGKEVAAIKKRSAKAEDPLLPLRDMMIQFIKRADLSSLKEAEDLLSTASVAFLDRLPNKPKMEKWSAESILPSAFTIHLTEILMTLIEITEKEGLEAAKKIILGASDKYAAKLFEKGYFRDLDLVQTFWQKVADDSIGSSTNVFQEVVSYYNDLGEQIFVVLKDNPSIETGDERFEVLDNVFRNIGWLGERLLLRLPLEESPLMRNYGYSSEFDTIYNCLMTFSDKYDHDQPRLYPLIYFDALYVVFKRLVDIQKNKKSESLDESIYSIVFAYASFANHAIKSNNGNGAALAATRIKQAYDYLKEAGLNKNANEVIKTLVHIGMLAAGQKETMESADFLHQPLEEWIIDKLVESGENIDDQVHYQYLHVDEVEHDARWGLVTALGKRLGTNFGFMFDPFTGELYSEDDPRRR